jgi:hypothetical protein
MKDHQLSIRGVPLAAALRLLMPLRRSVDVPLRHVFLCVCDHYEPYWGSVSQSVAHERVDRWVRDYPAAVEGLSDCRGRVPQHTFFYPAEDYDPVALERLAELTRRGYGEVEVHLHHDRDSSAGFRDKITSFVECLHARHGLLHRDAQGRIRYGFIHGNWALDNARPDGRWCGVNDEITILRETGCYADFTLPCAPEPGQTRIFNSIYYAIDDPQRPKSHDVGIRARVGARGPADGLLMIQGPLAWTWSRRKWGLLPRLENGDLHGHNIPDGARFRMWQRVGVAVEGRPDWVFIKLHTHGAIECNSDLFLNGTWRAFHQQLAEQFRHDERRHYYYVTAREMAELVHQAEQGVEQPILGATPRTA